VKGSVPATAIAALLGGLALLVLLHLGLPAAGMREMPDAHGFEAFAWMAAYGLHFAAWSLTLLVTAAMWGFPRFGASSASRVILAVVALGSAALATAGFVDLARTTDAWDNWVVTFLAACLSAASAGGLGLVWATEDGPAGHRVGRLRGQ
jgi:hypothetical protein